MADGSIRAYRDTIDTPPLEDCSSGHVTSMDPIMTYQDIHQSCVSILPMQVTTDAKNVSYELWIGQRNREITVLNAKDLSIVDFVSNDKDCSPTPRFLADLSFANLISNINGENVGGSSDCSESVLVYGALQHGQYISTWDAISKELVTYVDCLELIPQCKDAIIRIIYCLIIVMPFV